MSKKKNKEKKSNYQVNNKSTRETFLKWLGECGNNLQYYSGVLSCCGSDGPDITKDKVGSAHFNIPEEVENYLQTEGLYEEQDVMCGEYHYIPPTIHYLDWFRGNYE